MSVDQESLDNISVSVRHMDSELIALESLIMISMNKSRLPNSSTRNYLKENEPNSCFNNPMMFSLQVTNSRTLTFWKLTWTK
jgi:hypothetical protein